MIEIIVLLLYYNLENTWIFFFRFKKPLTPAGVIKLSRTAVHDDVYLISVHYNIQGALSVSHGEVLSCLQTKGGENFLGGANACKVNGRRRIGGKIRGEITGGANWANRATNRAFAGVQNVQLGRRFRQAIANHLQVGLEPAFMLGQNTAPCPEFFSATNTEEEEEEEKAEEEELRIDFSSLNKNIFAVTSL